MIKTINNILFLGCFALAFVFLGGNNKAKASGWPTFDVAHTVSEVTALVGDISKTVQKPMEIMSFGNISKSLGPLGESLGGKVMGKMKDSMGGTLKKMKMKKTSLSKKAKGSMDSGVSAVKKDEKIMSQKDTKGMTQEQFQDIKAEREKRYKDAAVEGMSLSLAHRSRAASGTTEKTDEIIAKAQAAEDKRGAYTANTLAVIEVCNELMMTASIEVARLKLESSKALHEMKDISIKGDIKEKTN